MDNEAMRQAIIRELYRQGVEFGKVVVRANYSTETHFIIETYKESEITPKYLDSVRIENQVTPPPPPNFPIPDGLEHIRELDQDMAELMALGLIEKKDCGYAIAS